ncbi:MAG TPA: DNA polymerase III subunit delta [Acidimicrobiales bacterium]|nr:DNA polymerase III subunit delta [Acidimicrobiales bacterium]
MTSSAYLITGDDASLVSEELSKLLGVLSGDSFVPVEEHSADGDDSSDIAPVLEALVTPPFLADRRVVVLRGANKLDAAQASQLAERLKNPVDGNICVLVVAVSEDRPARAVPAALSKVVKAVGEVVDSSAGQGRQRSDWLMTRIRESGLKLDAAAAKTLLEHLGEDVARLASILEMLEAAYGQGGRVGVDDLMPFLGDIGGVPPWELTDAIDKGDYDTAIAALHRMMNAGGRHPMVILSTLHKHFGGMLRLDGAEIRSGEEAAAALKMSPYPAKKILEQGRRLGHERVVLAIGLIADADANLRGLMGWPGNLVMEVLVARLVQLGRASAAPARS